MFASSFGSNFLQIGFFSDALRISFNFFWSKVFDLFNLISLLPILCNWVVCRNNFGVLGDFFLYNNSSLISSDLNPVEVSDLDEITVLGSFRFDVESPNGLSESKELIKFFLLDCCLWFTTTLVCFCNIGQAIETGTIGVKFNFSVFLVLPLKILSSSGSLFDSSSSSS